jgi:hypothetical protein
MAEKKPMIAVPIGDPAGVGPEIVAKACALEKVNDAADVIVIGDRQVMERAIGIVGADLKINVVDKPADGDYRPGILNLIDLDNIDYPQAAHLDRLAEATIILTVATQHTVRSSAKATTKADAYDILDVLESVIEALDGWRVPDTTQALIRTRLAKAYSDQSYDVYTLTFTTAWVELAKQEGETVAASPSINVRLNLPSE